MFRYSVLNLKASCGFSNPVPWHPVLHQVIYGVNLLVGRSQDGSALKQARSIDVFSSRVVNAKCSLVESLKDVELGSAATIGTC